MNFAFKKPQVSLEAFRLPVALVVNMPLTQYSAYGTSQFRHIQNYYENQFGA
jgi:hypothetical protein